MKNSRTQRYYETLKGRRECGNKKNGSKEGHKKFNAQKYNDEETKNK